MKTKILAVVLSIVGLSTVGQAAPIKYDVTYSPELGPTGVGSFFFDNSIGAITSFNWDFEGVVGFFPDGTFGTADVFGDTRGRFLFELLAQVDVHSGANCLGSCGAGELIPPGFGPFNARDFNFSSSGGVVQYFFDAEDATVVATGTVAVKQAIPEPGAIALLLLGLLAMPIFAKKRSAFRDRHPAAS